MKKFVRPRARLRDARFRRLYRKYRDATMVGPDTFLANLRVADYVLRQLKDGAVIECGTWRGGMSAALIEIGGPKRQYHFFDSFEGLPAAGRRDGARALAWSKETEGDIYHDNCAATRAEFEHTIGRTSCPAANIHIHQGWFKDTVSSFSSPSIAVLRLDGDWYNSTMICLEQFWKHVLPNGVLLIDDYYAWEGCARAVHDFLSSQECRESIRQADDQLAFIIKRPTN